MTDDLAAFLRARLDEDAKAAEGTGKPIDWHQGPGDDPDWTTDEMVLMWPPETHTPYEQDKHWRGLTADGPGLAAHIARHDPARVLAEVDAKRRILAAYTDAELVCAEVTEWANSNVATNVVANPGAASFERWNRARDAALALEPVIRLLALPYASHPDYQDVWRPRGED